MTEATRITEIDYDAIRAFAPEYEDSIREAADKAFAAEKAATTWNVTPEMKALVALMDEAQESAMART